MKWNPLIYIYAVVASDNLNYVKLMFRSNVAIKAFGLYYL